MSLTTRSSDGTTLHVEVSGNGPVLLVLPGALTDATSARPLAAALPGRTVAALDRRGRRSSGDAPAGPRREVTDVAAVVAALEERFGPVDLYGHSSGACLALLAAAGVPVRSVVAYEPPWSLTPDPTAAALAGQVADELAAGRPEDAVAAFLADMGPDVLTDLRGTPWWDAMVANARSLPHDLALLGDGSLPRDELAQVGVPVLVCTGTQSDDWFHETADAVVELVPRAARERLAGQDHAADPAVLAAVLESFLASGL
jgi:pimeloyl-ACP methyl ester carboxylesterase